MNTAQLMLSDLDARVSRIQAMLGEPAASSTVLREAGADTPIVGEILASLAFVHDATPTGHEANAREDARRMLAMILALRELEREATSAIHPPALQTNLIADLIRAIVSVCRALLNIVSWVGAMTYTVFRGLFHGLWNAARQIRYRHRGW